MTVVFEPRPFHSARRKRHLRVQTIQSLDRGLFIDAEHGGVLWRVQIEPDDIGPAVRHARCTVSLTIFNCRASLRTDQWIEPSLGLCRVASRILACSCGVITVGFCPGCRSSVRPFKRSARSAASIGRSSGPSSAAGPGYRHSFSQRPASGSCVHAAPLRPAGVVTAIPPPIRLVRQG
jgi:hypothetical protein